MVSNLRIQEWIVQESGPDKWVLTIPKEVGEEHFEFVASSKEEVEDKVNMILEEEEEKMTHSYWKLRQEIERNKQKV